MFPSDWPPTLRDFLTKNYGLPLAVDVLSVMSGASVWRVTCAARPVVVKVSPRVREQRFYREVAPFLRPQAVLIPDLLWYGDDARGWWLVLEYVPQPLPRERWTADPQVFAVLRALHLATLPPDLDMTGFYCPAWTDATTMTALGCLSDADARRIAPLLRDIQRSSQHLFTPTCPTSCDPNPGNWAMRANADVVLFDWERFTLATPALDYAITLPGLPDMPTFARAAMLSNVAAHDLARAKVWSVVEFLSMLADGIVIRPEHRAWLVASVPQWIEELAAWREGSQP